MKLFESRSAVQRITLRRDPRLGLTLLLDDMPQFAAATEYRYHECLAVAPWLFKPGTRVFIGGGGDGLAAARLIRLGVTDIVVCDYDRAVTDLAREQEDLVRLNDGAMLDSRVRVVNEDAAAWLRASDERFDLIICDFPDPYFPELGEVYSRDFYQTVYDRLTDDGVMVVQTLSVPAVARIVRSTVSSVFPHEAFYRPTPGAGFTLGAKSPLARSVGVPPWCMFLSEPLADALFVLPRDVTADLEYLETPPNEGTGLRIIKTALAFGLGPNLAERHPYRPDALEVYVTAEFADRVTGPQGRLLVQALAERGELIVVVSEALVPDYQDLLGELGFREGNKRYDHWCAELTPGVRETIAAAWDRISNSTSAGSAGVAGIEVRTCRPSEDAEVGELLDRYLADYSHRFYDTGESHLDRSERGRYAVTRDTDGRAVGLFKLLEHVEADRSTVELEILFGVGTPRQHLLSLILVVSYLDRVGADAVECYVPQGVFGRSLQRLGARKADRLRVYSRPDA